MRLMKKVEPRTLAGFMELLPSEQILFEQMKNTIEETYQQYGFLPIDTPIQELSEVLLAKAGGETEKQIYRFEKGDTDISLRFYQCDIDIIGDGELSILNDAELPSVIYTVFKKLGFDNFTIRMNNRKLLNGLFEEIGQKENSTDILRIIDKIDKIGKEAVQEELIKLGVEKDHVEKIMAFILIKGNNQEKLQQLENLKIQNEEFNQGLEEIRQVLKYVGIFGVPEKNYQLDLTIARGLDYYTGTVYETFLNDYRELGSVCSGGRYENLADYYTDKKLPGVGISIGLTRLFYKLNELNLIKAEKKSVADALVISMVDNMEIPIKIAKKLRSQGKKIEVYLNNKKIKAKFKYADKLEIPYVIIIGEDEIANNTVKIKNMQTGEEKEYSQDNIKIDDI